MSEARTHYKAGIAHFAAGRTNEAIEAYRKALALDETLAMAWNGLAMALAKVGKAGLELLNVDTIITAERPHLGAWKEGIRSNLAGLLDLPIDRVCVKAKTNEGLGPVGEGRAIEAHAVVLLRRAVKKRAKKSAARKPAKAKVKSKTKARARR